MGYICIHRRIVLHCPPCQELLTCFGGTRDADCINITLSPSSNLDIKLNPSGWILDAWTHAFGGAIGNFNQQTYRVIIEDHILPFAHNVHDDPADFVLQEDNCGLHGTKYIATYLANNETLRMTWPVHSPEINPIENVLGIMKSRLRKLSVFPSSPMLLFHIS